MIFTKYFEYYTITLRGRFLWTRCSNTHRDARIAKIRNACKLFHLRGEDEAWEVYLHRLTFVIKGVVRVEMSWVARPIGEICPCEVCGFYSYSHFDFTFCTNFRWRQYMTVFKVKKCMGCFLGPTRVQIPNGISVGSAVFAGLTSDRLTDRQTTLLGR